MLGSVFSGESECCPSPRCCRSVRFAVARSPDRQTLRACARHGFLGLAFFLTKFRRPANRTGRADHVVKHQGDFPFDRSTDDGVSGEPFRGTAAAFVDNRQSTAEPFCMPDRTFDAAFVGTDDDRSCRSGNADDSGNGRSIRVQRTGDRRDIKKTLNLSGVQVHRQHAIGAGPGDHVGHQFGRDRHAAFVLAVLSRITKIGDHRCDSFGTGPHASVDHDQQFHQVVVHRRAGRLDQEDVSTAHVFV